jgi:predicted Zn-dependent peptidase
MLEAMTREKLDNQRDVVKNEKRQRYDNQPYGDWDEQLQLLMWPEDHPYRHTVIGSMEDLDAASLEDVAEFFRTYYIPNNAVLTVAGDAEPERVFAAAERWFGSIPAGPPPPPVPGTPAVPPVIGDTVRAELVRDVPLPRLVVGLRIPPFTDPRFDAVDLCAQILGQGKSSRLYRSLVRERRVARDAATYALPLVTGGSTFLAFVTGFPDSDVAELEAALFEELEAMAEVSEAEVARGRVLAEAREVRGLESMSHRADLLSMYTTIFDDPGRLNDTVARIRGVTTEQVRAVARDFLGPDNRAVVAYLPQEEGR